MIDRTTLERVAEQYKDRIREVCGFGPVPDIDNYDLAERYEDIQVSASIDPVAPDTINFTCQLPVVHYVAVTFETRNEVNFSNPRLMAGSPNLEPYS